MATYVLLAPVVTRAADDNVWRSDFDSALAEAKRLNRPLLVHFYADWCPPCRQMDQNVLHREQVQRELRRLMVPVKVNADRSPAVAERYHIDSLPTDLFLEPDGTPLVESTGYRGINDYLTAVGRAALKYSDLLAQRAAKTSAPAATEAGPGTTNVAAAVERKAMLNGYSPVTLWKSRKWEKGSAQFQTEYKGQTYQLVSSEELREFNENPTRYAPRFLGCDPVIVYQSDRAVLGSTKYGAFYDDELYLFVNNDNRQAFKANPDQYIRTRVVLRSEQIEQVVR
jgi:YHS domain-containing protein/thiol-disulfide isomerase/thioredoxin